MNKLTICLLVACLVAVHAQVVPQVIPVLSRKETSQPSGPFSLSYVTGDGISVNEEGRLIVNDEGEDVLVKSGNFAYTAPDGTPITLSYVADQFGFRANGAHLPVAPSK